jgi:hypothetical protein
MLLKQFFETGHGNAISDEAANRQKPMNLASHRKNFE